MWHMYFPLREGNFNPLDIAEQFRRYYTYLYNLTDILPSDTDQADNDTYIQESGITCLPEGRADVLEQDLKVDEFFKAVRSLKLGKAPGLDGYTPCY